MSIAPDTSPHAAAPERVRRFRLVRGGARDRDRVIAEPPPKQVLLSPRAARWLPTLGEALGPSYEVVLATLATPAATVIDSREEDLAELVHGQRAATRIIVVHSGHPSEQPMAPSALLDLGADTYLASVSLPALAAHVKALTRSWDAFPPRPRARAG
jgi:hypothetical protein